MIKRYWVPVLCSGLFLANGIAIDDHAQASTKASVQSHIAAAKNAAYEPGNDLTVLYDTVVLRPRRAAVRRNQTFRQWLKRVLLRRDRALNGARSREKHSITFTISGAPSNPPGR